MKTPFRIRCRITGTVLAGAASVAVLAGCGTGEGGDEEPEVAPEVTVHAGIVTRATLRDRVTVYGVVDPEPAGGGKPAGAARLAAPAAGIVVAVPVREGERVEAGAVVVRLDDRMARARVEMARHALEFASQQSERQARLAAIDDTSAVAVEEARQALASARAEVEAAEAALAQVNLVSPLAGIVTRVNARPGEVMDAGAIAVEVADPHRLVVTAAAPAGDAGAIKIGQAVELFAGDTGDAPAGSGSVAFVSPQVDPGTDAIRVRIAMGGDSPLRSGATVRGRIVVEEREGRLAVPREAVQSESEGRSVIYTIEDGVARQRAVSTGLRDGGLVEVEGDGVVEGAAIVTIGSYALPGETKVRIAGEAGAEEK